MALFLSNLGAAGIILTIAVMLASGFLLTRITKRLHLPNVTGYIIAGVIIGPWCLNLVPSQYIEQMDFITDLALAFIAFGVGKYFKLSSLKANGKNMVILTLFESLTAGIFITIVMLIMGLSLSFSLLLGAIGCATAPASTIMTIRQYKARGPFVDTILQVVALDDAVSLIAFSVCAAFVQASSSSGSVTVSQIAFPVLFNLLAPALGGLSGVMLSRLIHKRRSKDHSLVLACVTIMGVAGICTSLNVSPLLACMASGTAYINASGNKHLFKQLNQFTPPPGDVLRAFRHETFHPQPGGRRRDRHCLLSGPHCWKIHRLRPGLRGYPRFTGNTPLLWPGAGSSGRRVHRPGCAGTAYAPRRKRPAAVHYHSVQRAFV